VASPAGPHEPDFTGIDCVVERPGGLDRATARTGGIERIAKSVNKLGEITVTIAGKLLAPLWRGDRKVRPAGMMFAPRSMNQELQNRLAEQSIRTLRDHAAQQNGTVRVVATAVAFHPNVVAGAGLPRALRSVQHVTYRIIIEVPRVRADGTAMLNPDQTPIARTAETRMTVTADPPGPKANSHLTFDSSNAGAFLTELLQ